MTLATGKRKKSTAKASISEGKGIVKVNGLRLEHVQPKIARLKIQEPIILAGDIAKKFDIKLSVQGGGVISRADASRLAIAKAIVAHTKSQELRQTFLNYDRTLLVADVRQRESRKPNRHGNARGKTQKSYR